MADTYVDGRLRLDGAVWNASSEMAEAAGSDSASASEMYQRIASALDDLVGFDMAGIQSAAPGEPWTTLAQKGDTSVVRRNYWRYISESTIEEIQRICNRFVLDVDVLEPHRRDRLSVYHEFVLPNRQAQSMLCHWTMDGRLWLIGLLRARPSFSDKETRRLELIFPHLRAALRAVGARANDERLAGVRAIATVCSLTPAQERVTSHVVRGLTNEETAGLLGISRNTVRNTLCEVFKKIGVSTRSELAFLVSTGAEGGATRIARREAEFQRHVMTIVGARR